MRMLYTPIAYAPDEPAGGPGPAETPAEPAAAAPTEPATPWADSLGRAFPDEATRGQVDQYLRSEIQPYITRKEQELGEVSGVWENLWDEDQTIPTYLSLAESIYGPELAREVAQTFAKHFEVTEGLSPEQAAAAGVEAANQAAVDAQPEVEAVPDFDEWLAKQPPEVREIVTNQVAQNEDDVYNGQLAELAGVEPTIKGNEDRFSRYVVATEGDLNVALALWQEEMAPVIKAHPESFGTAAPATEAPAEAKPAREAPAVLGSQAAAGVTTPPQIKAHQTMDEAIHDFMVDITPSHGTRI